MKRFWLLLLGLLGACMPQNQASLGTRDEKPILIEGGVAEGRIVRAAGMDLALPSTPLALSRNGDTLYAAYPFQLLIYQNGFLRDSQPLPGVPRFMHSKPLPVVATEDRLYLPGQGSYPYKAKDAVATRYGLFWINAQGLYLDRNLVAEGNFEFLAAGEQWVYAFGQDALRLPDQTRIPLPGPVKAAVVLDNLYVLTPDAIYKLSPEGLQLGRIQGRFEGLKGDSNALYTLQNGALVKLSLNLEVLP
ncbi:MAG: hypothetical protein K6T57_09995 [Thermaceae bacterium]|nr:hypothetical protein [Thermaceae bacterium]